jgi:YVTN family beta-propeller protein
MARRSDPSPGRHARRLVVLVVCAIALATRALAAPFAYVVNHGDGTVSVLDTATNAVVATVEVGDEPLGAAVHPSGSRTYVANQVAPNGTVSVIDTASNTVIATVPVGARPSGVAVKLPGNFVYVTNRDDKNVSVIDTATNAVVATIAVGNNPLGIAIDPAGTPAYVVNKGSNNVSVIDTTLNAVVATIPVGNDPSQVAIGPNGQRAYVSNSSNTSVSVIDTSTVAVVATVPVGSIPEGLTVDPSGARLYVANSGPNSVSVVDTATNTVLKTIDVGLTPFEVAIRPDGARLFVLNRASGNVSVVDTATNTVAATVPVGFGPAGMGQFIVPALPVPRFGKIGRKCQVALEKQGIKLAKLHHGLEATCRLGVIKAEAAGTGTAAAQAACQSALDLGNPNSRLSRGRAKLRAAVEKSCALVVPRQLNGPCLRSALGFATTIDCVVEQHAARTQAMVGDELSATQPVPLAPEPLACQTALVRSSRMLADRYHKELGFCLEKLLVAADTRKGETKVVTRCLAKLDLRNVASKAAIARAKALVAIGRKCVAVSPAEIGSPCDPAAATTADTASCVVDAHVVDVGKLIAAELNDACVMVTRLGLGSAFPAVCSGAD